MQEPLRSPGKNLEQFLALKNMYTQRSALTAPMICFFPQDSRNREGLSVQMENFSHIPFIRVYYGDLAACIIDIEPPASELRDDV